MSYTHSPATQQIKRAQKEKLLLRELSNMLLQLSLDDKELEGLFINRVELSSNKSCATIYFYYPEGEEKFREKVGKLILYKPSIRQGVAKTLNSRYVPEIKFAFDAQFEKQQRLENLLEKVKKDLDE